MEIKNSFVIGILMLIVGGIRECLAVKHLIVTEGDTLVLKCLRKNSRENGHMEWRNPNGHVMFFNNKRGLRDSRNSIFTLNNSEYTIHMSSVTLKDEGVYKCLQYDDNVTSKRYKVKVLGTPKIEIAKHEDKTIIKCSVAANGHPPKLSWLMSGIEIEAQPNTSYEEGSKRSMAVSVLNIKTHIKKATVICQAKYQALQKPLVDFVIIDNDSATVPTLSYSTTMDILKTETMITATSAPLISSTAYMKLTSVPESPELYSTEESTTQTHYTNSSDTNSTEGFRIKNDTSSGFGIEDQRNPEQQHHENQSSPLLVLLVTCLILCLLVVVIFFAIKLRRAHLAWKRENEESDQSVESSKSKSSHEEKQAQERRRNGFWNSKFTEYKVEEETPQNQANSNITVVVPSEAQDSSRTASSKLEVTCVKETEL